jgi:hypothetical protein
MFAALGSWVPSGRCDLGVTLSWYASPIMLKIAGEQDSSWLAGFSWFQIDAPDILRLCDTKYVLTVTSGQGFCWRCF